MSLVFSLYTASCDCLNRLLLQQESDPNQWFAVHSLQYHNQNISAVAQFIGAKETNVVFVENATTGR